MLGKNWYQHAVHRNVIDMHITADDERFLTEFDADAYVRMLKKTHAQSAVVYAQSHVGLANFATTHGCMHPNLRRRDIFRELCDKCHEADIAVVAYMSLIYDMWSYDNHPHWRMKRQDGTDWEPADRYCVCCPNAEGYRAYIRKFVTELCQNYPFEGIRFDMTFWPGYCYCDNCRDRFRRETGLELPDKVNWFGREWTLFQRKREEWLCDFAKNATDAARLANPDLTVEHQSSTYTFFCHAGVSADLRDQNDFLQGDFYGGFTQGSTACKLFYHLSPKLPFGFETSANASLNDHTTLKHPNMLYAKTCMALANGGAFIFIDAIDPIGTLDPHVYETMGDIFAKTQAYEPHAGGRLIEDVAVYLSTESKCSFTENGKTATDMSGDMPHTTAFFSAAASLIKNHIPFGVLTRKSLDLLSQFKVIILPNVLMMSAEEAEAFRQYVKNGGKLYASKYTSLVESNGVRHDNFMLADVLGVNYADLLPDRCSYLAPTEAGTWLPPHVTRTHPLFVSGDQLLVNAGDTLDVHATVCAPYFEPQRRRPFSATHSDPPGRHFDNPGLSLHRFGKGEAIYCSAALEDVKTQDELFANLIKGLLGDSLTLVTDAPRQVEVTLFEKDGGVTVNLISLQQELPNLPIPAFSVIVRTNGRPVRGVRSLPDGAPVEFKDDGARVTFTAAGFDTFSMYKIEL